MAEWERTRASKLESFQKISNLSQQIVGVVSGESQSQDLGKMLNELRELAKENKLPSLQKFIDSIPLDLISNSKNVYLEKQLQPKLISLSASIRGLPYPLEAILW